MELYDNPESLNKTHWISVEIGQDVPDDEVLSLLRASYALVVKGLTRVQRAQLSA